MSADFPNPSMSLPAKPQGPAGRRWLDLTAMAATAVVSAGIAVFIVHKALAPHVPNHVQEVQVQPLGPQAAANPSLRPTVPVPSSDRAPAPTAANFGSVTPTPSARRMADWVVARQDNGKLPFVVLDKRDARLYVFHPDGQLVDQTPVLLGSSHGDDTYPGIGDVPIAQVKPYQRTTAAGRFVTRPGLDEDHTDVVWLDYDAALAMHRVINKVKSEHRLDHLASPDAAQRRISWGCINIPIDFFDRDISPVFGKHAGVAYVIPERKSFEEVFEKQGASSATQASADTAAEAAAARTQSTLAPKNISER